MFDEKMHPITDPPTILALTGVALLVMIAALLRKKVVFTDAKTRTEDIPAIFQRLQRTAKDGSFVTFMFTPPGERSSQEAVNLQFSIEQSRVGLDWVLLAPSNVRDKERFAQFASARGYRVFEREMNKVKYLRVEDGGSLPDLCKAVIHDLYFISPESQLDLLTDGFAWP